MHGQVALVVAQRREEGGRLSGIKLSALSTGLQRVAKMARRRKGELCAWLTWVIQRWPLLRDYCAHLKCLALHKCFFAAAFNLLTSHLH